MSPQELLLALMRRGNMNPTSLAKRTGAKQPQIHRFLAGDVKEPKRSTWEPVAKYFNVPVEAFLDAKIAARTAAECGLSGPVLVAAESSPPPLVVGISIDKVVQLLADHLAGLPAADRPAAGALLDSLARTGGAETYRDLLTRLLTVQTRKQSAA